MKIIPFLFILTFSNQTWAADSIIKIEVGKHKDYSNDELRERVWNLERAVQQLQDKVFELSKNQTKAADMVSCYINTPFDGTFTATAATETAAKGEVMAKCGKGVDAGGSIHCSENKVKCGK